MSIFFSRLFLYNLCVLHALDKILYVVSFTFKFIKKQKMTAKTTSFLYFSLQLLHDFFFFYMIWSW